MLVTIAAAVIAAIASKEAPEKEQAEVLTVVRPTPHEVIENKTQVQARVHQSIDLRVTVFAVMIITIAAATIKDGRGLFTQWNMIAIATATIVGLVCVMVAAFISMRNIGMVQSVEEIKRQAESENPMDTAAVQLHAMQKITVRKSIWANLALVVMLIDAAFLCYGIATSWS